MLKSLRLTFIKIVVSLFEFYQRKAHRHYIQFILIVVYCTGLTGFSVQFDPCCKDKLVVSVFHTIRNTN